MGFWLKNFSILAVLGFPLAVVGTRAGLWQYGPGLQIVAASFLLACVVLALSLITALWTRKSAPATKRTALIAAAISLLPVLGIGTQLVAGSQLPAIHNISTDVSDPPQFVKIPSIRDAGHNALYYDAAELADLQTAAYPGVTTLYTTLTMEQAHMRAVATARSLGWEVVHQDADAGLVEATETTKLWNFKDDVVIRLRSNNGKTAVDLRSVSRVGRSDLGANAKRIEKFLTAFSE